MRLKDKMAEIERDLLDSLPVSLKNPPDDPATGRRPSPICVQVAGQTNPRVSYTGKKAEASNLRCFKTIGIQIDPKTIDADGARFATMKHIISEISVLLTRDVAETDVIGSQSTQHLIEYSW